MPPFTVSDLLLFAEAYLRLTWASAMVAFRPRHVIRTMLLPIKPARRVPAKSAETIARDLAAAARWHVLRPACLTRSLALRDMLLRRGYPAVLRVSLDRDPGKAVIGHAWIEMEGRVLNDRQELSQRQTLILEKGEKGN
ncbi:MAG: lasso peptide biosynthesis B2 protein [Thermoanaerobaculia bacterium]